MVVKSVGLRAIEGVSKKSGKPFKGVILYYVCPSAQVVGYACEDAYIDISLMDPLLAGCGGDMRKLVDKDFDLSYGPRGFLDSVRVI